MSDRTRIALVGAAGRMGREILALAELNASLDIGVAIVADQADSELLAHPRAVTPATASQAVRDCDVVVDFSSPRGFDAAMATARDAGLPLVSGTTGLTDQQFAALDAVADEIPVIRSPNFSAGVNVLEHLVELASAALAEFDIEVFEAHHRNKVDAPSGTALFLGEAAARGRDLDLDRVAEWGRHGQAGARTDREIGFQVVRGGSIVGEHTVFLCGAGERIELTHRAQERAIFARGAVRTAQWIVGRAPARYTMRDVLFGAR